MGLWYPKDTGLELTAFLDSDHAGCLDSRKSTSGGIQFLGGDKLVSWSSKAGLHFNVLQAKSRAAIAILVQSSPAFRTKHIDVRYHLHTRNRPKRDKTTVLQPHSSEVGFINHMLILKLSKAQVDQGSQIKMIQVKEMMQDNDLKNSKSKDKGSKSRSQSMDEQSHYKQDKTITRQSINVKRHIFNVIGGTEEFEERDLNIGGDC
ncbi:hypothetical protein Tco_0551124 [Tanacetum coccineum]